MLRNYSYVAFSAAILAAKVNATVTYDPDFLCDRLTRIEADTARCDKYVGLADVSEACDLLESEGANFEDRVKDCEGMYQHAVLNFETDNYDWTSYELTTEDGYII